MAQYVSSDIIVPTWPKEDEIFFLQTQLCELEAQAELLGRNIYAMNPLYRDPEMLPFLSQEITLRENTLSPICRVPPEILSRIFELSCIPDEGYKPNSKICVEIYTLSSVCMAWRIAAHATSSIWTKICVDCDDRLQHNLLNGGMDKWVARSRGRPLDFYLHLSDGNESTKVARFMRHILDFRLQIRSLYLKGEFSVYLPLFHLPPSSLPMLEKVSLEIDYDGFYNHPYYSSILDSIPHGIQAFLTATRLQHVEIIGYYLLDAMAQTGGSALLPEIQLASLEIDAELFQGLAAPSAEKMLCRCTSLVNLAIHSNYAGFDPQWALSLTTLRSLDIDCPLSGDDTVNLLHCLTAPSLERLTLQWNGQDVDSLIADITGFQKRSAGLALSSLALQLKFWDNVGPDLGKVLVSLLAIFSTISSFRLDVARFHVSPAARVLSYTEGHSILPKLTHLYFKGIMPRLFGGLEKNASSAVREMILSRCRHEVESNGQGSDRMQHLQKVTLPRIFFLEDIPEIPELPDLIVEYE